MNISVIVPSYNPDEKLISTVRGLAEEGFKDILVVNDGSDDKHLEPFVEVEKLPQVTVIRHEVNKGKGRAMKTAFLYCMENRKEIEGVVTVDGDGQHRPADVRRCCEAMRSNAEKKCVALGCRDFSRPDVPPRSRMGNNITKAVFRFACGIRISDTQTGLRAIPASLLPFMADVEGERYEYETQMLLEMNKAGIPFEEVTIDTVYIEENASSHFHPFRDSFKIYSVILKFVMNSLLSFVIDIALFTLLEYLIGDRMGRRAMLLTATVGARAVSSLYNYHVNRGGVFESDAPVKSTLPRYYVLCVCQMLVSYGLVYLLSEILETGKILTSVLKVLIDTTLFLLSFQIQRRWVFAGGKSLKEEE